MNPTDNSVPRAGIDCERCGIELGVGRSKCRRAEGTDVCISCAFEMYPPIEEENLRGGPIKESPSYREALRDAGRGY